MKKTHFVSIKLTTKAVVMSMFVGDDFIFSFKKFI